MAIPLEAKRRILAYTRACRGNFKVSAVHDAIGIEYGLTQPQTRDFVKTIADLVDKRKGKYRFNAEKAAVVEKNLNPKPKIAQVQGFGISKTQRKKAKETYVPSWQDKY